MADRIYMRKIVWHSLLEPDQAFDLVGVWKRITHFYVNFGRINLSSNVGSSTKFTQLGSMKMNVLKFLKGPRILKLGEQETRFSKADKSTLDSP